jgi:hypothetical protein
MSKDKKKKRKAAKKRQDKARQGRVEQDNHEQDEREKGERKDKKNSRSIKHHTSNNNDKSDKKPHFRRSTAGTS